MTESEYQATIRAARVFGRIQVHQQFRALARELGLPDECSARPATPVLPRQPRWYAGLAPWQIRLMQMDPAIRRARLAVLQPGQFARGGLLTSSVA